MRHLFKIRVSPAAKVLRLSCFAGLLAAQTPHDASPALDQAYRTLAIKDYDSAIASFETAIQAGAVNASVHKDFAYTLLKTGENVQAREEFAQALKLNARDENAALEFAFLAYETKEPIEARRTFNRLRHSSNLQTRATAEQAFQNIDRPLAEGIRRWQEAISRLADPNGLPGFSAHWELARTAELRDDLNLAAEQYEICRKIKPQLGELLLDLARVWKQLNQVEDSRAALLAASRSRDSRTAELALAQLDSRYPFPYEFLAALKIDPWNVPLRRELAYLYLAMNKESEAAEQFKAVLQIDPKDDLSRKQLDLLFGLRARRVNADVAEPAVDAKALGKKSLTLGYLRDALRYLQQAHEQNPDDAEVMLALGWAYNQSKQDQDAIACFDRARRSDDPRVAAEASKAFHNLNGDTEPQTTIWTLPMFSTRWKDFFSYAQLKRTMPVPGLGTWNRLVQLYISVRLDGDLKGMLPEHVVQPQYLSEDSLVFGAGLATKTWHHLTGWVEAGESVKYLPQRRDVGAAIPDYRGGLNFSKGFGSLLGAAHSGLFYETTGDAVYMSRFDKDWLFYSQHRAGRTFHLANGLSTQLVFNLNYVKDSKSQYWANTVEVGPGARLHLPYMPPGMYLSADFLHGMYTGPSPRSNYNDLRLGVWFARTR